MSKSLGWVLLVLGLVIAGYGVALAAGGALPGSDVGIVAWGGALVVGLICLVVALMLVTRTPTMSAAAPPPAPTPEPETVEVKRTEMQWASRPAAEEGAVTDEVEAVRQQLARLKVQYGLGEISAESYRRLSAELETKLVDLERAQMENR